MRKGQKMTSKQRQNLSFLKTGKKRTPFKRGPHSEEHKRKISISHIGKKMGPFSEEHRKKISDSNLGKNKGRFSGEKNPMFGRRGVDAPAFGRGVSESTRQKRREWALSNPNRKFKDTGIEIKIEEELKKRQINYVKQVPLCKITISDFYLPDHNIAIFADGCYWHSCPLCKRGNIKDHVESDLNKTNVLISNGFNVYRFWEHEINESVENCINKLML